MIHGKIFKNLMIHLLQNKMIIFTPNLTQNLLLIIETSENDQKIPKKAPCSWQNSL